MAMNALLWKPDRKRKQASRLYQFMNEVRRDRECRIDDYSDLYRWSIDHPRQFWQLLWDYTGIIADRSGNEVLENHERMPGTRWFPEARLNFSENLLRRRDETAALVFWGENQIKRTVTHGQLYDSVSRMVQALQALGIQPGDRVAGYLPNMPETIMAMLACSALGAIWSSCSPDFGTAGVIDRFGQIEPRVLFSADGYFYNGKVHDSLKKLKDILPQLPSVELTVVIPYVGRETNLTALPHAVMLEDWLEPYSSGEIIFTRLPFEHPLYILFSSGTTGIPKCIVHGVGGTLLQHLKEHQLHSDVQPGERLFYFTTCGWMMWNWLVSGLASEATLLLYDGSPFYPDGNTLFDYADAENMTHFGTSARYLEALLKSGLQPRQSHRLDSLKTLMSTGSPLSPEGFRFVYDHIKEDICLSSISGGTDIVSCFALGNPLLPVYSGELQCRGLAMKVEVFDESGQAVVEQKGELVCTAPFPSMPVGFWNDPDGEKYRQAYFSTWPGVWCHGDYVKLTENGGLVFYGRSDAVLNPGGVRIGTAEIYRQLAEIPEITDAVTIGQQWRHDVRVILFVVLKEGTLDQPLVDSIRHKIRTNTTPRHVPAKIIQVPDIPRTRSGKIVEIAVRDTVHGKTVKNNEALANPEALQYFENLPELREE